MKARSTKKALLASLLSLVVCVSLLVGSTFAWFTDSVTSAQNVIQSGNLDVTLEWMDGKEAPADPDDAAWKDASTDAIFNYNLWEPGYTTVRHIKIGNEGSLALKYKVVIEANGTVSDLTDVIDVYYFDPAQRIADRTALAGVTPMGTLTSVLGNMSTTAQGELAANTDDIITIALKMKETAGNEYMNKSVGDSFVIKVFATQLAAEYDSFGNDYDVFADYDGEISTPSALEAALKNGGAYKVLNDITVTEAMNVPAAVNVELDLNGKTITGTKGRDADDNRIHVIVNNGTLTIAGGTVASTGTNGGSAVLNKGVLTLEDVTIEGAPSDTTNGDYASYAVNTDGAGSQLTVNNANISGRGAIGATNGAKVVVNGGTYKSPVPAWGHCIYAVDAGTEVTINGGTFSEGFDSAPNDWTYMIYSGKSAKVTVNGGTFSAWDSAAAVDYYAADTSTIEFKGGTFSSDPTNWVADGHTVKDNGDGTWTVEDFIVYDEVSMGSLYTLLPTLPAGETLVIPEGTYVTTGTFAVAADVTIKGEAGKEVIFRQDSDAQDDIFNCAGNATFENITFESNYKGYAIAGPVKEHNTDGDITVINCKFKGIATEKNWGIYKNLNGNLTVKNCTFDNYNNALCGINNGNGSTTVVTGCTFTNINGEAIGYVSSTMPANFEADVIANNTGLTAENVIGY